MQYYVMKTGMEMFDVCRAYGLGLVLDALREEGEEVTSISDSGIYYSVEGAEITKPEIDKLEPYFSPDKSWNKVFLTLGRASCNKKVNIAKIIIINKDKISQILENHKKCVAVKDPSNKETLYQSMDIVGTKGYRVPVRRKAKYTEGSSMKVASEDWALAALGEAHFSIWIWKGGKALTSIIPKPERVLIMHWKDIRNSVDQMGVNRTSISTMLAHLAILLVKEVRERKKSGDPFMDVFSSLIYGAMTKTGNQWKPARGGMFPVDFLYDLIRSDSEISGDIFELWSHVFRIGNGKGREDLSLTLSEFVAYPTSESIEKYFKVHLRYLLQDDVPIRAYPDECIKEILKNVRS